MARAFYQAPAAAEPDAGWPEAAVADATSSTVYLLSAFDPNPALEALGATRLGAHLSELTKAQAAHFTTKDPTGAVVPVITFAGDRPEDLA